MSFVYILKSLNDNNFYIGSTRNLDDRIKRHMDGRSKATKNRLPVELVYKKEFTTYLEAYRFEMYIKKQKSKKFIKNLIKENSQ